MLTLPLLKSICQVDLLLSAGADINSRDLFGNTALHKSAAIGDSHIDVTRRLVEAGGRSIVNLQNRPGETALDSALIQHMRGGRNQHSETVRFLLNEVRT